MLVRPIALRAFVEDMTPMGRRYLDSLIATAYLMSTFTLDPATVDNVRKFTSGQRLYLDTNVLYALLKLAGPMAYLSTKRALTLSGRLGYEICVTPWTLTEMQQSLRAARLRLARQPAPQAFTEPPLPATGEREVEAFIGAFRRTQRDTGIDFEEFVSLHESINWWLALEGVAIVTDGCESIDEDDSKLNELGALLENARETNEYERPLQEHDVKHRLLVERLRGYAVRSPSDAGYVLLTNNHVLVRYAKAHRRSSRELPFAISLNKWADIVRSLTPRSDDYQGTLAAMLDTPSVRSAGLVTQAEVIEAISRISAHGESSEALSTRTLLDATLLAHSDEPAADNANDKL
jgi:hypothetical protein